MGDTVGLQKIPRRICSLVPSLTELLFDLGLDEEIVGVTRYCTAPEEKVAGRTVVGGTKDLRYETIEALAPDLVIGSREENDREGVQRLRELYPVWVCDVVTLDDALGMIRSLGALVGRGERAERLAGEIAAGMRGLEFRSGPRAAYLIWKDPYMAAGGRTFIGDMLRRCGFTNIFEDGDRYPRIAAEDLAGSEVVLLASEPYPFTSGDVEELAHRFPAKRVRRVDGTLFSWYGSRMARAPAYFQTLRGDLFPDPSRDPADRGPGPVGSGE